MRCSKIFPDADRLSAHCIAVHRAAGADGATAVAAAQEESSPASIVCDRCDRLFMTVRQLHAHQKRTHGVPAHREQFECFDCHQRFRFPSRLRAHMLVHSDESPVHKHTCQKCGKAFDRPHRLNRHVATVHRLWRSFPCGGCGQLFARRGDAWKHERSHQVERTFVCDQCGTAFTQADALRSHLRVVHQNGEPFECKTCGETFSYAHHHNRHQVLHTGDKPYACEVCGKRFANWDNRKAHEFTHSYKKPFECSECGKGYIRRAHLLLHLNKERHGMSIVRNQLPEIDSAVKRRVVAERNDEFCWEERNED